jgi:hypothetical protein
MNDASKPLSFSSGDMLIEHSNAFNDDFICVVVGETLHDPCDVLVKLYKSNDFFLKSMPVHVLNAWFSGRETVNSQHIFRSKGQ